jgi:hypothetical protein
VRREHLGDEERVPLRRVVQCVDVDVRVVESDTVHECPHRSHRERLQFDAGADVRSDVPQPQPQRVPVVHLVAAERHDEQGRALVETPGEEREQVERGVVGPVEVLQDEHDRSAGVVDEIQCRRECRRSGQTGGQPSGEIGLHRAGCVDQRAERAGRVERIAHTDERARNPGGVVQEGTHQARLADPGLAGDHRHAAMTLLRPRELVVEQSGRLVALEELRHRLDHATACGTSASEREARRRRRHVSEVDTRRVRLGETERRSRRRVAGPMGGSATVGAIAVHVRQDVCTVVLPTRVEHVLAGRCGMGVRRGPECHDRREGEGDGELLHDGPPLIRR